MTDSALQPRPAAVEDPWRPRASPAVLRLRAALYEALRAFFKQRGVLEVETPLLSAAAATDPQIESFATEYRGPGAPAGRPLFLHTSPEFPMKRLLAAGSGPIYQLCKVFRQGEAGARHHPEFTMLEWYRPGFDLDALMGEVEDLARILLAPYRRLGPTLRLSYGEAFQRYAGLDPHACPTRSLCECAARHGLARLDLDRDGWLQLLMTHLVEPRLPPDRPVFIHDYPASQAALARVRPGPPPVAERFELYLDGLELANGFHELSDAHEQGERFAADRAARRRLGLPEPPADARLLAALAHGLPDCSGVALGMDRLLMLAAGARSLDEVLAFPLDRA